MTVAICIACGEQKFGAWTPCRTCGFQPENPVDKAKSLTLTEHHHTPEQLDELGRMIRAGGRPHFDCITLRREADSILESDYFLDHHDPQHNLLDCVRCGQVFTPEGEEIYCPQCIPAEHRPLSCCQKCSKLLGGRMKSCPDCGAALTLSQDLTPSKLAGLLAATLRQAWLVTGAWDRSEHLRSSARTMPEEQFGAAEIELETVAVYAALHTVRQRVPSAVIAGCIAQQMIELFQRAWHLAGLEEASIAERTSQIAKRTDEYDYSLARYPHSPELGLGDAASRACFGIGGNIQAALEILVFFGYFTKVFGSRIDKTMGVDTP